MKRLTKLLAALAAGLLMSNMAQAALFNFGLTFDGTTVTVDASSDPIAGTSLVPGDSFILDIRAAGNDYWNVLNATSLGIYAGFLVLDSGTRTGNVTTSFLLDEALVAQDSDLGIAQSFVHMGAQNFSLTAGMMFDQVIVEYSFLATTSTFTTIQASPNVIAWDPFFREQNVSYVPNATVPEPGSLALAGLALAGLYACRKRKCV